ncbi:MULTISPECIES: GTP cyclohydrolase I [Micromonospora]|uniref:GTP cyclohydrolase I n=1 Tax=Micromonospora TaxID=1873 RepID=UPI000C88B585|nr:GTP cyclohydrolase I [Verrucosispora sp. ts21]PMR61316.1 GTP cyclohydrolase I FolE [Verrucosispora sp. ts21]
MTTTLPDLDGSVHTVLAGADVLNRKQVEQAAGQLLRALGVPADTEVGRNTPRRMTDALVQLLTPQTWTFTTFPNDEGHHDLVLTRDIAFTSLCAHHLLPFSGHAHIGLYPGEKLPGLSKIARTVRMFAARLQVQENLGQQIARFLDEQLACDGVGVVLVAEHLCMTGRGVRAAGADTVTVATRGRLQKDHGARAEFIQLALRSSRAA